MKRIFLLLLSLLLSAATPAPQTQGLLQTYSFYDQPDWEHLTSAVMFWADLDQNGVEEPVSFTLDRDEWTTAITWGESTVVLEEGDDLVAAAALDLDAESPFYNLLVTMDYGSDSYVTVELPIRVLSRTHGFFKGHSTADPLPCQGVSPAQSKEKCARSAFFIAFSQVL